MMHSCVEPSIVAFDVDGTGTYKYNLGTGDIN